MALGAVTGGRSPRRPIGVVTLVAAVSLQGVSGVAGGAGLVLDPTGASMGIPQDWLSGSPFDDYLIPGIILLVVLGIEPLVVAFGLWRGWTWAWAGALGVGVTLILWIAVEVAIIGYQPAPPLQLVYGILGVLILAIALQPTVRRRLRGT
jgi:peptidoglycan/LPS O-acetylase OafA/YrhL